MFTSYYFTLTFLIKIKQQFKVQYNVISLIIKENVGVGSCLHCMLHPFPPLDCLGSNV